MQGTQRIPPEPGALQWFTCRGQRWETHCRPSVSPPSPLPDLPRGQSHPFDHNRLDLAGAPASECSSRVVFRRCETGDALLEGWKFDHDESMEFVRTFHDLKTSAPSQYLATKFFDNRGHKVSVLLVLDGVIDFRTRNPISRHRPLLIVMAGLVPAIHVLNDETVKRWIPGTRLVRGRRNRSRMPADTGKQTWHAS